MRRVSVVLSDTIKRARLQSEAALGAAEPGQQAHIAGEAAGGRVAPPAPLSGGAAEACSTKAAVGGHAAPAPAPSALPQCGASPPCTAGAPAAEAAAG